MEPIPDTWPPEPSPEAPMFPLPGVFLFPMQLMPLHVFEPRYRQMIEDCLDGPGRIVMATVPESAKDELPGAPEVHTVAGLGEIARHQRLPDGRYVIWLAGLARVRIDEAPSDRLYRRVRYEILPEISAGPSMANKLREPLEKAILARREDQLNLPDDVPTGLLADILLQHVPLPEAEMVRAFAETDAAERARIALEAHQCYPG
jgi:Lon protease-like protein